MKDRCGRGPVNCAIKVSMRNFDGRACFLYIWPGAVIIASIFVRKCITEFGAKHK